MLSNEDYMKVGLKFLIERSGMLMLVLVLGVFVRAELMRSVGGNIDPVDPQTLNGEYKLGDEGEYYGQKVLSQYLDEQPDDNKTMVLGDNTVSRRIEIDLTNQRLYAFENEKLIHDFVISSGKWGRTPTGTFRIWGKFKYIKMSGGSKELNTYYYLPNVPYVMFFENDEIPGWRGFGLHGTYWHNNFGVPMSHGCVNMRTEDAKVLFYWTSPTTTEKNTVRASDEDPGTEIVIYGKAPK